MGQIVPLPLDASDGPPLAVSVTGKGRMYRRPGTDELYPSVTSIIGVLDKPKLVGWAARETALAAWDNRNALLALKDREAAVDMLKNARYRTLTRAGNVGTFVHGVAEALVRDEPLPQVPDELAPYVDSFLAFVAEYEPEFSLIEGTVISDEHRYAGTLDFLAVIDGIAVLGDHKTGKGVYPEVSLQLAALRFAELVWDRSSGELRPMPRVDSCIAVHLRPTGKPAVYSIRADRSDFAAFLGARAAWPWSKDGQTGAVGPVLSRRRLAIAGKADG